MTDYQTGLCSCCAAPGGVGLCCRTCFCPCTVMGDIHAKAEGSFICGCLLGLTPLMCCAMAMDAPKIKQDESCVKAFLCTICCPHCFMMQVWREGELSGKP